MLPFLSFLFPLINSIFSLPSKSKQSTFFLDLDKKYIIPLLTFLSKNSFLRFTTLLDVWALDYPNSEKRYQVCYALVSVQFNLRFVISVRSSSPIFPSVTPLYQSAGWLEREVWDMHGIFFSQHQDLRRILSDYGFEGFPLLKDFPLSGYTEIRYDHEIKACIQEPLSATQEYRYFDFSSPWVGKKTGFIS
jgi:NADH-quinone oxidoreductase subunit C